MTTAYWSVADTTRRIAAGEITAVAVVEQTLARIAARDGAIGAYLAVDGPGALAAAAAIDHQRTANVPLGPLAGVPLALKDVLVTRGLATTAGSKILDGWVPPYDAHVVDRLRSAGAIVIGKVNCDEFAMGSSTENSAYQPTRNPWDSTRVPGGSSGGSSAAVAAGLCAASLGTDTGGSIRQPAAFCGVVGLKPTYGRVSRWGVVAFASSLDQVGPLTRTVADAALVLQSIAGFDPRDSTSLDVPVPMFTDALTGEVRGLRIGLPQEYFEAMDDDVRAAIARTVAALVERGAEIVDLSLPHTKLALPAYYLVAPAEASSNLARFDGVRYGARAPAGDLLEMYARTRGAGFGPEVKRRIMLGTYALRSGYYDAFYKKAQQVRTLIKRDFDRAFHYCDVILTPTTPTAAFAFGAKASPVDMYLADVFTLSCNLAGLPGISVPCGLTADGLPIGAQLLGKPLDEATLLRAGQVIEAAVGLGDRRPPEPGAGIGTNAGAAVTGAAP
ncbi:MAG TPA: Asp-tRNA(Asn)/Glu-tRNA(Gln) amidotransferase subunit GatA [Kofleriaceae bacterium]|nr:Asp-tRNA(Asn)/Glu-tRNA(Gln) amidotransferase subunit GatA [Kofleriaceae bacterium]